MGELVLLENNESIPADLVILETSEPDGICFVETKNLDGETNLKMKSVAEGFPASVLLQNPNASTLERVDALVMAKFKIICDLPNPNLYAFSGTLILRTDAESLNKEIFQDNKESEREEENNSKRNKSERNANATTQPPSFPVAAEFASSKTQPAHPQQPFPLTINQLMLRGCVLRNTRWAVGMVVFAGKESKLMLNFGGTPSKRSLVERRTDRHVWLNFAILFSLSFACLGGYVVAQARNSRILPPYAVETFLIGRKMQSTVSSAAVTFVFVRGGGWRADGFGCM